LNVLILSAVGEAVAFTTNIKKKLNTLYTLQFLLDCSIENSTCKSFSLIKETGDILLALSFC